ncbi:LysR family transcriptional regulator [Acuticoccus sp. I52.16.1]|uniref:LysR family transcriptional regulator n=1 Tax=Acuticoccus sp. I52.16.1 TaxID=2928472 RepID=UPI001FD178AC|nr:LysR family transcriptional regulator [Acuticoccus sp. I52.16.1]UOM33134.1 LysR family transcriptional regulator [Acuticoccus sp. I52.16.1]
MRHMLTLDLIEAVAKAGSIRKAAEVMNLTSSALNRRLQAFEEEFGTPIFERLPQGVRPNAAGELILKHIRAQRADLHMVRTQVDDLVGVRRGHVAIACSQALTPFYLPDRIAAYRTRHPGVTFSVSVRDRAAAEAELSNYTADLALVFEPVNMADFEILSAIPQPVCAVMAQDHPLASAPRLRLRDCLDVPHVVPSPRFGVRHLLDVALRRTSRRLRPVVEADSFEFMRRYVTHERAVGFEIPIGLTGAVAQGLAVRPLDPADVAPGHLLLGQLLGRTLPVAASRFAEELTQALRAMAPS